jgi:hypothetical protein
MCVFFSQGLNFVLILFGSSEGGGGGGGGGGGAASPRLGGFP